METEPEASVPASPAKNRIRIEVSVLGESFANEVTTDVFLRGIQVNRRADEVRWRMDWRPHRHERRGRPRRHRTQPHDVPARGPIAIIGPILEELQRCG